MHTGTPSSPAPPHFCPENLFSDAPRQHYDSDRKHPMQAQPPSSTTHHQPKPSTPRNHRLATPGMQYDRPVEQHPQDTMNGGMVGGWAQEQFAQARADHEARKYAKRAGHAHGNGTVPAARQPSRGGGVYGQTTSFGRCLADENRVPLTATSHTPLYIRPGTRDRASGRNPKGQRPGTRDRDVVSRGRESSGYPRMAERRIPQKQNIGPGHSKVQGTYGQTTSFGGMVPVVGSYPGAKPGTRGRDDGTLMGGGDCCRQYCAPCDVSLPS